MMELESALEDGNVVVDLGSVPLRDAFGDPDDVPALLLLQLQEGVEDPEVELLHERVDIQLDLQRYNKNGLTMKVMNGLGQLLNFVYSSTIRWP